MIERRNLWRLVAGCALALLGAALIEAYSTLPPLEGRSASSMLTETADTRLGRAIEPRAAAHPGKSGVYPLLDGQDAFAARVLLARAAERSLDVQYYIWKDDLSGRLLLDVLRESADRGVRVRLLLDDNNTSGLDPLLAALDSHPNFEVRLFNPIATRKMRLIGYLADFPRLNRRMHNKSFTADGQATIVGGRNIGDEYFDAAAGLVFVDLDVMAVGSVVADVSRDFDRYWASESSYPLDRLVPPADPEQVTMLASSTVSSEQEAHAAEYREAVRNSRFVQELVDGSLAFEWASAHLVSDDPAKVLGRAAPESRLLHSFGEILGRPETDLSVISAYFVPAEEGTALLTGLAEQGVSVRVLTNSLQATDVPLVHAGYMKRRKQLLEAGVTLYELRLRTVESVVTGGFLGGSGSSGASGSLGSSVTSLHAKTFAVDQQRLFIGSFNFDPRSIDLNTEMGLIVDSPALARRVEAAFEDQIPAVAYEARLSEEDRLYWIERRDGRILRHESEPGTTFWRRAAVRLLSWLPIEWLL